MDLKLTDRRHATAKHGCDGAYGMVERCCDFEHGIAGSCCSVVRETSASEGVQMALSEEVT